MLNDHIAQLPPPVEILPHIRLTSFAVIHEKQTTHLCMFNLIYCYLGSSMGNFKITDIVLSCFEAEVHKSPWPKINSNP